MARGVLYRLLGWCLAVWLLIAASTVWAQESIDFAGWEAAAEEIEETVEGGALDIAALEALRSALEVWRARFLEGTTVNSTRIETLEQQIAALGAPPAEGEFESEDISTRRETLTASLAEARAPRTEAEQALARANILISQIDERIRELQADAFFEYKGSPLLPSVWADALSRLTDTSGQVTTEISSNVETLRDRGELSQRLPLAILSLLVAVFLIVRGPQVVERLVLRVEKSSSELGQVVYGFLVSLGGILLPLIGISLIGLALISSDILGPVGRAITIGLNVGIIVFSASRWLGSRIFPLRGSAMTPVQLNDQDRRNARGLSQIAGALLAVMLFLRSVDDIEGYDGLLISVVAFPFLAALGVVLFFIGRLLRRGRSEDEDTAGYADYLLGISGRVIQIIGIIGPIVAAIGYYNFARGILIPASQTLALVAFLATLHYVIRAAYGMIRGLSAEDSERALVPVLISLMLSIMTLPIVALFWGARRTELLELWVRFRAGVQVGESTISPGDFLTVILVFFLGLMLTRLFQGVMRNSVLPRTRLDKGGRNAVVSGLGYVGITLAALAGITAAGIDLSAFAIVVGALGVGIGFGLQNIVNNFVSGIILLIERPIGEGDWVEVGGQMGTVKTISVRSTVIETFDRTDVIVPNGDFISGMVTNWTRGNSIGRVIVPVGVAYGTDTRKVEEILMAIAKDHPIVSINPEPVVLFRGFGADSLDFEIRAILTDVSFVLAVHSDMNHEIARRFAEEGIEIPFAQRDIWLRNPEALRGAPPPADQTAPAGPRPPSDAVDARLEGDDGDH